MLNYTKPKLVWKLNNQLGESPIWVKKLSSIFFVDIKRKKFFQYNVKNKIKKIFKVDKEIGFIAHRKNFEFIMGLKNEIRIINLKTKKIIKSIEVKDYRYNRINDGKVDCEGNVWFGTMDENERGINSGSLFCLNNKNRLIKIDKNYITPNGPAFINKNQFYFTDSKKKIIYKIKHNNFKITQKKIFKKFNKNLKMTPDGMTLDKFENLWVCFFRGFCVKVYNKYAKQIYNIDFPVKNITSCTFGDKDLDKLYFTTARKLMSTFELKKYHLSGSLFSVDLNKIYD